MAEDNLEFQIARLELEPGDILVVKTDRAPFRHLGHIVPSGVRVMFIPTDVDLSVLTKADIEARAVAA